MSHPCPILSNYPSALCTVVLSLSHLLSTWVSISSGRRSSAVAKAHLHCHRHLAVSSVLWPDPGYILTRHGLTLAMSRTGQGGGHLILDIFPTKCLRPQWNRKTVRNCKTALTIMNFLISQVLCLQMSLTHWTNMGRYRPTRTTKNLLQPHTRHYFLVIAKISNVKDTKTWVRKLMTKLVAVALIWGQWLMTEIETTLPEKANDRCEDEEEEDEGMLVVIESQ